MTPFMFLVVSNMTFIHDHYFYFSLLSSVQSLDNISQRTHIFVGIDVFGRGCLGGGGLNSDIALKKIREVGLSTAIFAPGDKSSKKIKTSKIFLRGVTWGVSKVWEWWSNEFFLLNESFQSLRVIIPLRPHLWRLWIQFLNIFFNQQEKLTE